MGTGQTDALEWLAKWYFEQCDGDWEEDHGVTLESLDNPGWMLTIDLEGTALKGRQLERELIERSEEDWMSADSDGRLYRASGGPRNLVELVERFRAWTI